jgi:ABC-2 type transport system ATP-binding protein
MNLLEIKGINKQFANHQALTEVGMDIPQGQIFGLLGPNGAGKTTLIRIINQITAPDSGELLFKNRRLKTEDVYKIGYLPEERGLYKKMKVGDQAVYLARLKGLSKTDAVKKLKFWFKKFSIDQWWDRKIEELSKGMQQKIQFIVTVLHDPELLIFDEPFSGFDPINANLLKEEILELKKKGATIIFSTHNMSSVEEVCDHIALINNSKKILDGNVEEIKQRFKSNLFECTYEGDFENVEALIKGSINMIEHRKNHKTHYLRAEMPPKTSGNAFLNLIMNDAHVISFNEVLPTMNDIFIKTVQQNK